MLQEYNSTSYQQQKHREQQQQQQKLLFFSLFLLASLERQTINNAIEAKTIEEQFIVKRYSRALRQGEKDREL